MPENPGTAAIYAIARSLVGLSVNGSEPLPAPYDAVLATLEAAERGRRSAILPVELERHGLPGRKILREISRLDPESPPPPEPPPARRTVYTADELLGAQFPEPRWAIPNLVPEGLTIMGGRPKMGKSWWALEASLAVGCGGRFMGQLVSRGKVIYFALEDSPKRLQRRMRSLSWPAGVDATFCHDLGAVGGTLGGLPALIESSQPTMVVVDTLSRAAQGVDQRNVGAVTDYLGPMQAAALGTGCAVLVIDHHRKPKLAGAGGNEDTDPVDELMESSAKGAVADAVIGLFRKRGERGATLKIVGRDMEDQVLAIEMDTLSCSWQLLGDADEVRQSDRARKIIAALRSMSGVGNLKAIAEAAGLRDSHTSAVLGDLVQDGTVRRLPKIGKEQPYQLVEGTGLVF